MKKVFQSLAVIALVTFTATSCTNNASEKKATTSLPNTISVTVDYQTDTTVNVTEKTVKTAPRFSCGGSKLKQPKLVGVSTKTVPMNISQSGSKTIDVNLKDYIDSTGVVDGIPVGNSQPKVGDDHNSGSGSGSGGTSNGSVINGSDWWWLPWIVGLALLALLIWFIVWLVKNSPERQQTNNNSSSQKTNSMFAKSAADPDRIARLQAMAAGAALAGNGKAYVKDATPGNEFEMIIGDTPQKSKAPDVFIFNTGNGTVNMGDVFNCDSNNNNHNSNVPPAVEPKKDEPVTPANP